MVKSLFITDLDGTLLKDDKTISALDIDTLSRLQDKGNITAIATGRSLSSFNKALKFLGLDNKDLPVDYLIFSTGAGIMALEEGSILQSHHISVPCIARICSYFDEIKFDYMVHRAIPDTSYFLYKSHGQENPDFRKRIELYQEFSTPLNRSTPLFESATQVLAVIPRGLTVSRVDQIRSDLSDYSVIHATSPLDHCSSWIEVFNKKASKSLAAQWLAQRLNISRQEVISVGNDYNDQDLLEWSGKGFLVANGACDLRLSFRNVASNNQCGVTRAAQMAGLLD